MTVMLCFVGGPNDGCWRRTSAQEHDPGEFIVVPWGRGFYVSNGPWDIGDSMVGLSWVYSLEGVSA